MFVKDTHIGNLRAKVPMVIYRKQGKFYVDYGVYDRSMITFWQAWFWYLVIVLYGKHSEKLFTYKKTNGRVLVRKIY